MSPCIIQFIFSIFLYQWTGGVSGEIYNKILNCQLLYPESELNVTLTYPESGPIKLTSYQTHYYEAYIICKAPSPIGFDLDIITDQTGIHAESTKELEIKDGVIFKMIHVLKIVFRDLAKIHVTGYYQFYEIRNISAGLAVYISHENRRTDLVSAFPTTAFKNLAIVLINNRILIPCRSYYKSNVTLWRYHNNTYARVHDVIYNNLMGFIIDGGNDSLTKFQGGYRCIDKQTNSSQDVIYTQYFLHLGKPVQFESVRISGGSPARAECKKDTADSFHINCETTTDAHMRKICMGRSCPDRKTMFNVSTNYEDRNYAVLEENGLVACIPYYGRVFAAEHFAGLDGKQYTDWKSAAKENNLLRISAGTSVKFSDSWYTFTCNAVAYILVQPIHLKLFYRNGTIQESLPSLQTNIKSSGRILQVDYFIVVPFDTIGISCVGYMWNTSASIISTTLNISVTERRKPRIFNNTTEHVTLYLNSETDYLQCVYESSDISPPIVKWWKDDIRKELPSEILPDRNESILRFGKVLSDSGGKYVCIVENDVGSAKKIFIVSTESRTKMLAILVSSSLVVIIALSIGLLYMKYREKRILSQKEIDDFLFGLVTETNVQESVHHPELAIHGPYDVKYEIPRTKFQIDDAGTLGKGAYGIVYKGFYKGSVVAVKTVEKYAEKIYIKSLLSELKLLIYLQGHPNIISIIGANTTRLKFGELFILVEYCQFGSLEKYLLSRKEVYGSIPSETYESETSESNLMPEMQEFFNNTLYKFSKQLADAMTYVSQKQVIHGDLAVRNVLISTLDNVKLTDFGLARKLYDYAEYLKQTREPLPWRHIAPEAMSNLTFSSQTDVWAYGVMLWEMFSLADTPYFIYNWTEEFVQMIYNGFRLKPPKHTPLKIQEIMEQCWELSPQSRPTFDFISSSLGSGSKT